MLVPLDVAEIDGEAEPRHEQEFNARMAPVTTIGGSRVEVGAAPLISARRGRGERRRSGNLVRALPRPRVRNVTDASRPATTSLSLMFFNCPVTALRPALRK